MSDSFEIGFPSGQFAAHGVDLDTAMALEEVFYRGTDPQPIIERIADPVVRTKAQRISNNLVQHPARGQGNSADSVNWDYLIERVRRYNQQPSDDLLYCIGTHVDALMLEDQNLIQYHQQGSLNSEQRFRVLNWLACQKLVGFVGLEIEHDFALLIFGRKQLQEWLERSQQAYPDFEFFLVFEALLKEQSGLEPGICFTMHWLPKPGAPEPNPECDFPWKAYWEPADMFWQDWFPGGNQFDFNLNIYPSQESFAVPDSFCEKGDRYTTPTQQEADLMPLAVVLEV